jgi:NodT family efflux transporter outer membrane factor (OMF) lipoprotein
MNKAEIMRRRFKNIPILARHSVLSVASILVLSACASLSESVSGTTQSDQVIPSGWLLTLSSDNVGATQWSALYDDPLLSKYLQKAESANYDIRQAQTLVRRAEADLKRSAARLKPSFNGSATASASALLSDIDDPSDSYGLSLSGRWDPDIFGQTQTLIDGSRAALQLQQALAEDTRQAVLAATARAYIQAVEAQLQVELAKTNLDFLTESRRISEARYRLGDTAKGDFSFAEANYQNALASYENTKQAARAAKRALFILLGDFPENEIELAQNLGLPVSLPSRGFPAQVLERRPDIVAARAQLAGSAAALKGAQLANWPSLDITGSLSSGSLFSDLFDPGDYIARLSAGLSQVIFDGGAIDAGIEAAEANLENNLLNYEERLRRAVSEITNAYDRADTLQRSLVNLEAASESANEALRLESIQFDLGESSLLDVLQVQTRVNSIDASLIRTKAALIETVITANEAVAGFGIL